VFAPVKNAEGADSDTPSMTRAAMIRLHTHWLRQAGVRVAESVSVEISPLWALDEQQVRERQDLPATIDQPTYLS
jgi:UDP-N-acetylglucosamine/UDP-N-acetylgalactosamine diphosphorylase